jgi:hypothetical protein
MLITYRKEYWKVYSSRRQEESRSRQTATGPNSAAGTRARPSRQAQHSVASLSANDFEEGICAVPAVTMRVRVK